MTGKTVFMIRNEVTGEWLGQQLAGYAGRAADLKAAKCGVARKDVKPYTISEFADMIAARDAAKAEVKLTPLQRLRAKAGKTINTAEYLAGK